MRMLQRWMHPTMLWQCPPKGEFARIGRHGTMNLFHPLWCCGQCERKVYLWGMQCKGCGICLTTVV